MKLGSISISIIVAFVAVVGLIGCESTPEQKKPGAASLLEDGREVEGAVVFLRGKAKGDRLVVEVVTRGAKSLQGIAFRLVWDPNALGLVEATAANAWSEDAVMVAKEGLPGELAVAWSEKGQSEGISLVEETVLGTLTFDVKGHAAATLSFRPERSSMMDATGTRITVAWRGGTVPVR